MYGGFVVERAEVKELYGNPQHPYTRGLLGSLPRLDVQRAKRLTNVKGQPPNLLAEPIGCPFAPRCDYAYERCEQENPTLQFSTRGHEIACWWDIDKGAPRYAR